MDTYAQRIQHLVVEACAPLRGRAEFDVAALELLRGELCSSADMTCDEEAALTARAVADEVAAALSRLSVTAPPQRRAS